MAQGFNVTVPGVGVVAGMDNSGNIFGQGALNVGSINTGGTITAGIVSSGGSNTSAEAAANTIAAPGFSSGVASQLSDLTRDYMVYIQIGTGGGTVTVSMGPTSAGTTVPILTSAVGTAGALITVRLPAGWFFKITVATSTIADQIAVAC